MANNEPAGITTERIDHIPTPWKEQFAVQNLPLASSILDEVFQEPDPKLPPSNSKGEVVKAKQNQNYIGLTDQELSTKVPTLIEDCLIEMYKYEETARKPAEERLKKLKEIAPAITRIIDISAPGDYYHLSKEDQYKDDPSMQGGDRIRSDQAAILAIVIAGIKEGWPDKELLLFLNQHVLTNNNPQINALREKAREAVKNSGIRLAYTGVVEEVKAIKILLDQKNIFIPKESVDIIGPDGIKNTIDQTKRLKNYLAVNLKSGEAFLEPINIQGIRSMRIAKAFEMLPQGANAYVYAMATSTNDESQNYRKKEVRGTVLYALTREALFDPIPYDLI